MIKTLSVKFNERVVLFKNGVPQRALGPGRYWLWGKRFSEQRWNVDQLLFSARAGVREMLPREWFAQVVIGDEQRAVLFQDNKPAAFLRPGTHRYWAFDETLELRVYDVAQPVPKLTDELEALIPRAELLDATVEAHQEGLLYVQGAFVRRLGPGRHRFWRTPEATPEVTVIDLRRRSVAITGQELMTRDKVTLRLSLAVDFAIADARAVSEKVTDLDGTVYLAAQLAARDYVSSVTLDQLLEGRDAFNRELAASVVPQLEQIGIRTEAIGVKDVVLPGEMKTLLNRVIEAEKEAAANVILRREEVAATRSLANTARVMQEQPVLLRLKELEVMKEIAANINEVRVVVGADGLDALLPAQLLSGNGQK